MRHRYRVSLYDDSDLDKEIVDYLSSTSRKQELIRTFIRAGFSMVIKKQEGNLAYLESMDDEQKALLAQYAIVTKNTDKEHSKPKSVDSFSHHTEEKETPKTESNSGYLKNTGGDLPENENASISLSYAQDSYKEPETKITTDSNMELTTNEPVDFMTLLQQ